MSDQSSTRALVVIDVQNEYDGAGLPVEFPPFRDTIANVGAAMDAARADGIKIVVVKQRAPVNAPIFAEGSHGAELHPVVASRPHDHLIEKDLASAFAGTDLAAWIEANGIKTLTVAGYMTHNCDLSTVLDAAHRGFEVEFLSDASGSLPYTNRAGSVTAEEMHRVATVIMQSRFAAVLSTAEWLAVLQTGVPAHRDTIHGSSQRARKRLAA